MLNLQYRLLDRGAKIKRPFYRGDAEDAEKKEGKGRDRDKEENRLLAAVLFLFLYLYLFYSPRAPCSKAVKFGLSLGERNSPVSYPPHSSRKKRRSSSCTAPGWGHSKPVAISPAFWCARSIMEGWPSSRSP